MEIIGFLLLSACVLGFAWHCRYSNKKRLNRIEASDPKALSRSGKLLCETDMLLGQIRGISARHDAFFGRYPRLSKEVQRLRTGDGRPHDNTRTIVHRALALKQQVEKEKEILFKTE